MAAKILWKKYKKYSGPAIRGTSPFSLSNERKQHHVDRAFWLTTKVETGAKFGSVMAYDGTGMTAGLDQHIAVYPKELAHEDYNAKDDQGSLWKLLRRLEYVASDGRMRVHIEQLWKAFEEVGWYLAQDGVLRYLEHDVVNDAGDIVFGSEIRDILTPVKGRVGDSPSNRSKAEKWITLFHEVFSSPDGFQTQIEFGKGHLVERTRRWNAEWPYGDREITVLKAGDNLDLELDLAMCMYHSHSVNAPGKAMQILKRCRMKNGVVNSKRLIKLLGTSSYGRWDDDIKNGRYQRTRSAARGSGLWPRSMFDGPKAIMPKNFSG